MIVHLLGFPGVGKYSIAAGLTRLAEEDGDRLVLVDNHLSSNVVLSVVEADENGHLPDGVWDRVGEIREVLYSSIEELSPPEWSFVFTNVLVESDPRSPLVVERLSRLATARSSPYVPVMLRCEPGELIRRASSPERAKRHKWTDAAAVAEFAERETLLEPREHSLVHVDVTSMTAEDAATQILNHLRTVAR